MLGLGWFLFRARFAHSTSPGGAAGLHALVASLARVSFAAPSWQVLWDRSVSVCELALWAAPAVLPLACVGAWVGRRTVGARLMAFSALSVFAAKPNPSFQPFAFTVSNCVEDVDVSGTFHEVLQGVPGVDQHLLFHINAKGIGVGRNCGYPVRTTRPTGVVEFVPAAKPTLGDLFDVWGQPLSARGFAGFRGAVSAWVGGRRWRGDVRAIPLRRHAEIVVEVGGYIPPHTFFLFPPEK